MHDLQCSPKDINKPEELKRSLQKIINNELSLNESCVAIWDSVSQESLCVDFTGLLIQAVGSFLARLSVGDVFINLSIQSKVKIIDTALLVLAKSGRVSSLLENEALELFIQNLDTPFFHFLSLDKFVIEWFKLKAFDKSICGSMYTPVYNEIVQHLEQAYTEGAYQDKSQELADGAKQVIEEMS